MDPSSDAFVIWLDGDAVRSAEIRGRVEHVQSAVRASFDSADELVAFLASHRTQAEAGAERS
jgi:hypothetical protein